MRKAYQNSLNHPEYYNCAKFHWTTFNGSRDFLEGGGGGSLKTLRPLNSKKKSGLNRVKLDFLCSNGFNLL